MDSTSPTRRYDSLAIGERRRSAPWLLDEAAIVEFAGQFDPQWFHTDPGKARASAFGGLIASGAHLLALWRRLDHEMNGDIDYYCGVELENVRFLRAVRPGDSLVLESEIVALRPSNSDPGRGFVTAAYDMTDQEGRTVLDLTAVSLVYR